MAVLVSTGYMEEAEEADIVYIIHEGHILSEGTPKEIIHKATSRCFSAIPPEGVPARYVQAVFLDHEDVLDAVPDGHRVRLTMREGKIYICLNRTLFFFSIYCPCQTASRRQFHDVPS